ncbi:MAG: hypothetical protein Tsb0020_35620 [Haliangiales bacterium]
MEAAVRIHRCALCRPGQALPASTQCRRCWRWLCADHARASAGEPPPRRPPSPPSTALTVTGLLGPCDACVSDHHALAQRSYVATRLAIVSGASVAGMVGGAITAMLLAWALELPGALAVLSMLAAEIITGGVAGRMVDKRVDRWLQCRAYAKIGRLLPRARALGRRDGERAERR